MKIASVAVSYPERVVTNEEILTQVEAHNAPRVEAASLRRIVRSLDRFFRLCGSVERRWRSPGERAFDHAIKAAHKALKDADLRPEDVDLLIYVGVGRGWLEPGMSHLFLDALGMVNATCFDVLDACLSWMRAVQLAHRLIDAGVHKRVLILSAEFNIHELEDWTFNDVSEVAWKFPRLTIGEAASATVLTEGADDVEPCFVYRTVPSLHTLCKIPLKNIEQFSTGERCPDLTPLSFFSYGSELFSAAAEIIPETYFASEELKRRPIDVGFSHQASATLIEKIEAAMGQQGKTVIVYPELGNTVSSSVPCSMAQALEDGRLTRGMQMMIVVGSAGFSAGLAHLRF